MVETKSCKAKPFDYFMATSEVAIQIRTASNWLWNMALNSWLLSLIQLYGWPSAMMMVLLLFPGSYGTQTDLECTRQLRTSFHDPNYLSSWDLSNTTEGSICDFVGIECWHNDESRVFSIRLEDMNLTGQFPRGIQNCTSLIELHLSGNQLSGSLPPDMDVLIPYLTQLELSNNYFTGEIPSSVGNCSFLNVIYLDNNRFSGSIPQEMFELKMLKNFTVANNDLTGSIPPFNNIETFSAESFANNPGLCGGPLAACNTVADSKLWFYMVVMFGVAFGFWGVIGILIVKKKWRLAYFRFGEVMADWIYVKFFVSIARLRRRLNVDC